MKIVINKDLIEIVDASNGVFKLHNGAILGVKASLTVLAGGTVALLMLGPSINVKYIVTIAVLVIPVGLLSEILLTKLNCAEIKEDSKNYLNSLIPNLRECGIDTSLEFIKKASTIETKYKLSMASFPPKIIQTKTISIPSYTIFPNIKETFIEQQHELGSEEYVLSLGNTSKKRKLVPSYNQV